MPNVNTKRESWVVTNNTSQNIIIGDIKNAPILKPNGRYNLLQFSSKEEINQSKNLVNLIKTEKVTLNKITDFENKTIDKVEASQSITSVEVDELEDAIVTVTDGEEITANSEGFVLFGKDPDSLASAVGISGEENNEVLTMDLDIKTALEEIYLELIKSNIQMSIITGNYIKNKDIDNTQEN